MEENRIFGDMALFIDRTAALAGGDEPQEIPAQVGSANLFSVLGVNPILGRAFVAEDGKEDAPRVVLLGYGLWKRRFGGDREVVGRTIVLDDRATTVVGVLPPDFTWHLRNGSNTRKPAELWTPWHMSAELRERNGRYAMAVARLRPSVTPDQAQAEMDVITARLERQYDFDKNWGVTVVPLRRQLTGDVRAGLLVLSGAVGFVLLIACANVA